MAALTAALPPSRKDTGDARGDAYFVLRGLILPVECAVAGSGHDADIRCRCCVKTLAARRSGRSGVAREQTTCTTAAAS